MSVSRRDTGIPAGDLGGLSTGGPESGYGRFSVTALFARWLGRNEDGWGQPSVPAESRTRSRREKSDTFYRAKTWDARVQLNNALDEDYILAAGSRTSLVVGDARSLKGSITYRF